MWRQNDFPGKVDSDQSISDEEEFNGDLGGNCFSFAGNAEKEEGLQLQSRLEILRAKNELSSGREISATEIESNIFDEDEVEMPDFPDEGGSVFPQRRDSREYTRNSDDEIIFNDEENYGLSDAKSKNCLKDNGLYSFGTGKQDGADTWSMVNKEAEALICLNENIWSSHHSTQRKSNKYGVKDKGKSKFSFHLQLQKDGLSRSIVAKNEDVESSKVHDRAGRLEIIENRTLENLNSKLPGDSCGEYEKHLEVVPAEVEALGHGFVEHSMAEILDGLQDKNIMPCGNSKMSSRRRGRRVQLDIKKSKSLLGDRIIDNEDHLVVMASSSSSDDDANCLTIRLSGLENKGQAIVDRFHDALAATSLSNEGDLVIVPKLSGIGFFGKLQKIMQSEKERDTSFLKRLQEGPNLNDEPISMVVKILSRCLEAKLTVCHCILAKTIEGSMWPEDFKTLGDSGREKTVIFNPRVCSDVDLEVGNFICIHTPWKEVQVEGNEESIVLSTYFSQILT